MKIFYNTKLFVLICAIMFLGACKSTHYSVKDIVGTYSGYDQHSSKSIGYNYQLELQENGICKIHKSQDIYNMYGSGKWYIKDHTIIIEYDKNLLERIEDVLFAGGFIEGMDTIYILNNHSLKLGSVKLKRKK